MFVQYSRFVSWLSAGLKGEARVTLARQPPPPPTSSLPPDMKTPSPSFLLLLPPDMSWPSFYSDHHPILEYPEIFLLLLTGSKVCSADLIQLER